MALGRGQKYRIFRKLEISDYFQNILKYQLTPFLFEKKTKTDRMYSTNMVLLVYSNLQVKVKPTTVDHFPM